MKAVQKLPDSYREIFSVDLQKNIKVAVLVNVLVTVLFVVFAIPMHFYIPITTMFDKQDGLVAYAVRLVVLLVLTVAYMILHELVHGAAMKLCGTKKVRYGITGLYAFAASDDYYDKKGYIFVALAPVVFWGVVIGVVNAFVSIQWFWVVYIIQLLNISGAAGDLYVTIKFARFPKDILVKDCGVGMTVYSEKREGRNGQI